MNYKHNDMEAVKVLFVTQAITPYVPETEMSKVGRYLPQWVQEKGREIRTFMPKWGIINERRNQLHEVIRLSGMNLIINDTDHPLIIKVASIQPARMQVYFIDNDDFFQRRQMAADEAGTEYADNDERAIFYARGVLETVKKLRWAPDIIHCQGWMSAFVPLYVKNAYRDEPSFRDSKVVFSVFDERFNSACTGDLVEKLMLKGIERAQIEKIIDQPANYEKICKLAIAYSDGFISHSASISPEVGEYARQLGLPYLQTKADDEEGMDAVNAFYDKILSE